MSSSSVLAARRPPAVLDAIAEKFISASRHTGWVQDSSVNYVFGCFGTGLEAVEAALKRRGSEELRVLDAGCGSAGHLLDIKRLVEAKGVRAYLRGVTAEVNRVPDSLKGRVAKLPESEGKSTDPGEATVDILVYQGFPLEDLAITSAADFIQEGRLFDVILCSWTLFHLCDPLGTLLQLRALLDSEGVLLANGAYFYLEADGLEAGGIQAMEALCARLAPDLECSVEGEPVRYVAEDPDDEWGPGDYQGGHQVCLRWSGGGREAGQAVASAAAVLGFTGTVLDKAWQLSSGPQYSIAAYCLC